MYADRISVCLIPEPAQFPKHGGVWEHLRQLVKCINNHPETELSCSPNIDILHVESSYRSRGRRPDIYVCHGGFLPHPPIPSVLKNLADAKIIVSVASWMVDKYFPQYADKTVIIPNGVDLTEWQDIPPSGIEPGYVLYAKEWMHCIEDFIWLAEHMPKQKFVATIWPEGIKVLSNVEVIGIQSKEVIRSVLNDAAALMLPGPEVCPTMLLEAWACKTPVIALGGAGSEEIMFDDEACVIKGGVLYGSVGRVGCEDLEGLRCWVEMFVESSKDFGIVGYNKVVAEYQWPDLFEQYVELYKAVIDER